MATSLKTLGRRAPTVHAIKGERAPSPARHLVAFPEPVSASLFRPSLNVPPAPRGQSSWSTVTRPLGRYRHPQGALPGPSPARRRPPNPGLQSAASGSLATSGWGLCGSVAGILQLFGGDSWTQSGQPALLPRGHRDPDLCRAETGGWVPRTIRCARSAGKGWAGSFLAGRARAARTERFTSARAGAVGQAEDTESRAGPGWCGSAPLSRPWRLFLSRRLDNLLPPRGRLRSALGRLLDRPKPRSPCTSRVGGISL